MSLLGSPPNTFANGQIADAPAVNANFNTIYNDYNGNITDVNIANTGITTYGKISGSALSTLGNINSGAGLIPNANVAALTVAGKVNGAALTGLASIPAGAGVIPSANLPAQTQVGFGTWVDKSGSYGAQQAATDGFVTVTLYGMTDSGSYERTLLGYTDVNANPTTLRVGATLSFQQTSAKTVSFTMPVKKNDYWKITSGVTGSGSSSVAVYWLPLGA